MAVHDIGQENGVPYIVSELIPGGTLSSLLSRGPLPVVEARLKVLEDLGILYSVLSWADDDHTVFAGSWGIPGRCFRLDLRTFQATLWKEVTPPDVTGVRAVQPILIHAQRQVLRLHLPPRALGSLPGEGIEVTSSRGGPAGSILPLLKRVQTSAGAPR